MADEELLQQWFELSEVEQSWGKILANLEFFKNPPLGGDQRIVVVENADVGYLRWQLMKGGRDDCPAVSEILEHGAFRIDVLIGPRDRRFVGLGSVALRRVREGLVPALGNYACFGVTSVHHLAARRAYEKAGFRCHYFYDDARREPSVAMVRPAP